MHALKSNVFRDRGLSVCCSPSSCGCGCGCGYGYAYASSTGQGSLELDSFGSWHLGQVDYGPTWFHPKVLASWCSPVSITWAERLKTAGKGGVELW